MTDSLNELTLPLRSLSIFRSFLYVRHSKLRVTWVFYVQGLKSVIHYVPQNWPQPPLKALRVRAEPLEKAAAKP
jgi:hypothetical protein